MKTARLLTAVFLIATLAGCTSFRAFEQGRELEVEKKWDEAVAAYSKALEIDPDNMRYRIAMQRAKLEASRVHFEKGKALASAGKMDLAAVEYQIVVNLDSTNQFAAVELMKAMRAVEEARNAGVTSIAEMKKRASTKAQPPQLNPASDEPISLSFPRETPVKDIYRALGNSFGINVMFDQGVKDDRIIIELRDVTAQQALERVMQAANHFYKILDERTIIIVPDTPQARRDYEDLVIRTFYLSNGDAEQVTNVVRTMIEARNVFPLKALNAITIRDTADKVRIAEKIIEANDKARAEVVVDVELLQLDLARAKEIGVAINAAGTVGVLNGAGTVMTGGTLSDLQNLGQDSFSFTFPSAAYAFVKSNSDTRLLAKPQLRISEGEKASLHIGQKVPVPVSTFTAANTGNTGTYAPVTSYQYQDVGIKISLEPRVHHNREVTLKLTVEVSNVADNPNSVAGQPVQPIIGTRTIESIIRLKDGETNFLAGLIREDDTIARTGTPFLGDIPLLGRLFNKDKSLNSSTDLVLTMTPHIIRIPDITDDDVAPMWVGTTNNLTFRGVSPRVESFTNGDPFANQGAGAAPGQFDVEQKPAGEFPKQQESAPNPVYLPPAAPPQDPFSNPPPRVLPTPPTPPTEDEGEEKIDTQALRTNMPQALQSNMPQARIAPQPATLQIKPGEFKQWRLVGMDIEGLTTSELKLQFDPKLIAVESVGFGAALAFDPTTPPAALIDPNSGTIVIRSTDGKPLTFRSGGEIVIIAVRGALKGEGYLVLTNPQMKNAAGQDAAVIVAGGRSLVQ